MTEIRREAAGDAMMSLLKALVGPGGSQAFGHLVIYTSFGVVRGRTALNFARETEPGSIDSHEFDDQVIQLNDVTVEHYSNHLPTANFNRLYIELREVQGFALVDAKSDGL